MVACVVWVIAVLAAPEVHEGLKVLQELDGLGELEGLELLSGIGGAWGPSGLAIILLYVVIISFTLNLFGICILWDLFI